MRLELEKARATVTTQKKASALLIGCALVLTGCASTADAARLYGGSPADQVTVPGEPAEYFTSDVDVSLASPYPVLFDWNIDTSDPSALASVSPYIVLGKVTSLDSTRVDESGFINTTYTVEVSENYGKENAPARIQLELPGGAMTLGEYIAGLDEAGKYELLLGQKSDEILREKGIDPSVVKDARAQDQEQVIIENYESNPTSESFLKDHRPDAFVFYLGGSENGVYYGAAFNHSLKYVRDGLVYNTVGAGDAAGTGNAARSFPCRAGGYPDRPWMRVASVAAVSRTSAASVAS